MSTPSREAVEAREAGARAQRALVTFLSRAADEANGVADMFLGAVIGSPSGGEVYAWQQARAAMVRDLLSGLIKEEEELADLWERVAVSERRSRDYADGYVGVLKVEGPFDSSGRVEVTGDCGHTCPVPGEERPCVDGGPRYRCPTCVGENRIAAR